MNTNETALVAFTYGCGLSDRIVAAVGREARERGEHDAVKWAIVDSIHPNRHAANNSRAPAFEGRATVIVTTKRGIEWSHVRVEKCSDGRWHAAG